MKTRTGLFVLFLLLGLCAFACNRRVLPIEREHFADPIMRPTAHEGQMAFLQKICTAREGAAGGYGLSAGGGCGCN